MNTSKYTLLVLALLASISGFGQGDAESPFLKRNEFKVNAPFLIAGVPELQFERILNEESSFGISVLFSVESNTEFYALAPYFRVHFGDRIASGFFMEANSAIMRDAGDVYGGLGFAMGYKVLSTSGWVVDGFAGLGRLFGDTSIPVYPRIGVCFGRRFGY